MQYTVHFPGGQTDYFPNASIQDLLQLAPIEHSIIISDDNVAMHYSELFKGYKSIVVSAGDQSKTLEAIGDLAKQIAGLEAHKTTRIIGFGGGMICDLSGFLASIYMRGIEFGFMPTTLLAMVDAAIGGKNGVNIGLNKNMLGTIKQPKFIASNPGFLSTLPSQEWSNGFAEIIKYACIADEPLWHQLRTQSLIDFQKDATLLSNIIHQCVQHKNRIVLADEQEINIRKTLNFGHTAGHAFETTYKLQHGQAVALGMIVALIASEQNLAFPVHIRPILTNMLHQYGLPSTLHFEVENVMQTIKLDKKRSNGTVDFILLESIGSAKIHPLTFSEINRALQTFFDEGNR
jgi:3-dehydroquinate synthase